MKALGFILAGLVALALLKVAVQVSLVVFAVLLLAGLLIDPLATLTRLGGALVLTMLMLSPVTALLTVNALLLAGLVTAYLKRGPSN